MTDLEVSHSQLVAPPGGNARKLPQYTAAIAATLGAVAIGSMLGWSSPVIAEITRDNNTDYSFDISSTQGNWISSLVNLGAAVACYPAGLVMDRIGRRTTMLLLVVPFTIGWLLITLAQNVAMLMAGRIVTGMAGGAFSVSAPAYTNEIAQDSIRGTLGSYFQLMLTVGILFSYVVGSYTSLVTFNWLCTVIPLIFAAVFFFMPESPKYLLMKGNNVEALSALRRLRGVDYDVQGELNALNEAAEKARRNPVANPKKITMKILMICNILMLLQQFSGINAMNLNTSAIFDIAGTAISPALSTIIIGIIHVLATFVSSLIVDKLGRKILLLFSTFVACLCTVATGVYFFLENSQGTDSSTLASISWLPLLSLVLFFIAFSMGLGPIPWMMAGELCTMEIKACVSSIACTINWLKAFILAMIFNWMRGYMGEGQVFWVFSFLMAQGFVFIIFLPETMGKSIEEMQVTLVGKQPNRKDGERK